METDCGIRLKRLQFDDLLHHLFGTCQLLHSLLAKCWPKWNKRELGLTLPELSADSDSGTGAKIQGLQTGQIQVLKLLVLRLKAPGYEFQVPKCRFKKHPNVYGALNFSCGIYWFPRFDYTDLHFDMQICEICIQDYANLNLNLNLNFESAELQKIWIFTLTPRLDWCVADKNDCDKPVSSRRKCWHRTFRRDRNAVNAPFVGTEMMALHLSSRRKLRVY